MGKTVVVGMSGGVDSSVSALLLKEAGYRVIGLFMKNWEELDANGQCKAAQELADVEKVCRQLDIPHYAVNFVKEYQDLVFADFLKDLKAGWTPNPDILCNREIKFKCFLEKALGLGADFLATGHYCQTNATHQLLKGHDPNKDQSYFLYTLKTSILERVLFPIGHLTKPEVRKIAQKAGLATSSKKDSTGICFIGRRDFKEFLTPYLGYQPGPFQTLDGKKIGTHDGMVYYTIGQRKGLKIGGPGDAWFVVAKDPARNIVYIEQGEDHPSLYRSHLIATDLSWVEKAPPLPCQLSAKTRYRQPEQPCLLEGIDGQGHLCVRFLTPQRAVTPRQAIVFYDGPICLGGGFIV